MGIMYSSFGSREAHYLQPYKGISSRPTEFQAGKPKAGWLDGKFVRQTRNNGYVDAMVGWGDGVQNAKAPGGLISKKGGFAEARPAIRQLKLDGPVRNPTMNVKAKGF